MYDYLYCENGGLNGSQAMWDSFQTSFFNAKNSSFRVSGILHARVGLCLRVQAKGFLGFTFPKIDLFAH